MIVKKTETYDITGLTRAEYLKLCSGALSLNVTQRNLEQTAQTLGDAAGHVIEAEDCLTLFKNLCKITK